MASSGPAPTAPGLPCAGGSRAGHRTPGGVSPERNRGAESPPSTCWPCCWWCSPGHSWPSGLRAHIVGSCPIFYPPLPPSLSPQGCSPAGPSQARTGARGCSSPGAGPSIRVFSVETIDRCCFLYWWKMVSYQILKFTAPPPKTVLCLYYTGDIMPRKELHDSFFRKHISKNIKTDG